jgi:hypothetical protein
MTLRLFFPLIVIIFSCQSRSGKEIVTKEVIEELNNREVRKVTESELHTVGFEMAQEKKQAFLKLASEDSMQCDKIVDQIEKGSGFLIRLVQMDSLKANNRSERTLIASYMYSYANDLPFGENIADHNEDSLVYTDILKKSNLRCRHTDSVWLFVVYLPKRQIILSL